MASNVPALEELTLLPGSHRTREEGVCALEAVAWLANEPHSDRPACVSPVIAQFVRTWNDQLPTDEERNRLLLPILPRLIGTVSGQASVEDRRAWMSADWLIREHTPAWLDLAKLTEHATALRSLPEMTKPADIEPAMIDIRAAARAAAGGAARAAAWDAARAAAGVAARAALRRPTIAALQDSALRLIDRMIAVGS